MSRLNISVSVDTAKLEAWIKRARTASKEIGSSLSKSASGVQKRMMEEFRERLPDFMEEVGLSDRSGLMSRETTVTVLRVSKTEDGSVMTLRVEGPPYVMIHETGGVIEPKNKTYLRVPFVREGGEGQDVDMLLDTEHGGRSPKIFTPGSGAGYFVMRVGKGGKKFKFPLLMERVRPTEGASSQAKMLRREFQQNLKAISQSGASSEEKSRARAVIRSEYAREKGDLQPEAFPVASLRKHVFMPRRPWLSRAVQHFNSKIGESAENAEVSYLSDRFNIDLNWTNK